MDATQSEAVCKVAALDQLLGCRSGLVLANEFFDVLVDFPRHSLFCPLFPLFKHSPLSLDHDFEMLVQDLNVGLAAHSLEQEVHFEISQGNKPTQVSHVGHESLRLLADNLGDPAPVLCSDLIQEEGEQEKLHSV